MNSGDGNVSRDGTSFAAPDKPLELLYVHGLFLRGHEAVRYAVRLRRANIVVRRFRYRSRREAPEAVAERLARRLREAPEAHVLAHSLGGLITLLALARVPEWRGRAVLLGSPVRGSGVARRILQWPGGRRLLGDAAGRLHGGLDSPLPPPGRVAVVAGTCNIGIGRLLAACPPPGDGIVRVNETALPGAVASVSFPTMHIGLVCSRPVIDWVGRFIRAGA